jgi:hypothetical protein
MTGPHRRKQWTPRTVRRMLYGFEGEDGRLIPRPILHVIIPGKLGEAIRHTNKSYADRYGPEYSDLLSEIGYTATSIYGYEYNHPVGLKYFDVGVWNSRFVATLTLRVLDPERQDQLPGIADFINRIQTVAGSLATVYGLATPMNGWDGERYKKSMPFHKYLDLYRRYPEPRKYSQ